MPIYDYRCEHCGHVFSAVQSFKDEALEKCPNCGRQPRRLITAPAIVFKGSGWYKTDSRPKDTSDTTAGATKSGTKTDTKAGSASDAKATSTTDTKSEAKSDTTSDAKPVSKPSSGSSGTSGAASS